MIEKCQMLVVPDGGRKHGIPERCPFDADVSTYHEGRHVRVCRVHHTIMEEAKRKGQREYAPEPSRLVH